MKDRLEEFVRSHSAEFDLHEPDPKLWKKIEKGIVPKRKLAWGYYLSRAAAVIFLIGATLIAQRIWMKSDHKSTNNKVAKVEIDIPELKEAEMYYTGIINSKLKEVEPLLSEYPSMEKELKTDLSELDSIYLDLKNDLRDDIANHEVIEAMIQNYRLRISILEDMLEFLESKNQEEKTYNTKHI